MGRWRSRRLTRLRDSRMDMDAFCVGGFAGATGLRGKPVVVGRPDQRCRHGSKLRARKYGVTPPYPSNSGTTLSAGSFSTGIIKIWRWSDRVATIRREVSPICQKWFRSTKHQSGRHQRLHGPPLATRTSCYGQSQIDRPSLLRRISYNTSRIKVASDQAKPRGLVWVAPGQKRGFLHPSGRFRHRRSHGAEHWSTQYQTVDQLAAIPQESSKKSSAVGRRLRNEAAISRSSSSTPAKSISKSHVWRRHERHGRARLCSTISRRKRTAPSGKHLATRTLT